MSNRSFQPRPQQPSRSPIPFAAPVPLSGLRKASRFQTVPVAPPYQLCAARRGTMLVNQNDVYMGQAYLKYGECCEPELELLLQLIKFPGLVIEVGANMGIHSVPLAAELQRQGRSMLLLEPQPVIFQQLCANLALNGLLNVTALPYACGDQSGMISFPLPNYSVQGNFGGLSMEVPPDSPARIETVPRVRLDDLVPSAHVGLIKIDVEGQELAVLEGAGAIIARSRPALYVENDRTDNSPQLIQWLWDHGYRLWWHVPPLFHPANYFGERENIYGSVCSFNMLCFPENQVQVIPGMEMVVDAQAHPLLR